MEILCRKSIREFYCEHNPDTLKGYDGEKMPC